MDAVPQLNVALSGRYAIEREIGGGPSRSASPRLPRWDAPCSDPRRMR
jgi:hypothetical protein